ncbi:Multidrug resistance-associated protein 6 [Coemansia nantahalensis]|nr:Multidrug resistance-associated protein 6 [Coemansia nantahalensis]
MHVVPLSDRVVTFSKGCADVATQSPAPLAIVLADGPSPHDAELGENAAEAAAEAPLTEVDLDIESPPVHWSHIGRYLRLSGYWAIAAVAACKIASVCVAFYADTLRIGLMVDSNPATMAQSLQRYLALNALIQIGRQQLRVFEIWPESGQIEFQAYNMRYQDDMDLVLKDLSFSIGAKEKIGIVGRTGAGKSSLTHALMRMVEPDSGRVLIDGVDTATIGVHDLRSHIGVIPQNPALFSGTIRDNLDPMHQYTDAEIWRALRAAKIDHLVAKPSGTYVEQPDYDLFDEDKGKWIEGVGLDKWVCWGGSNFSVGQRQLVSICRALLWQRRILVLDEATANIDGETDQVIQGVLRSEFEDCTVLTIAHRLDTVMDCDRILVMDQGRAVEFDSPANLLARDSQFAQLVECMRVSQGH